MNLAKINEIIGDAVIYATTSVAIGILITTLLIVGFIFWIAMLVHAIRHDIEYKPVWILVLGVLYIFGAIIYYFAVKQPEDCYCCADNKDCFADDDEDCCVDENKKCCLDEDGMKKSDCKKCNKCNKKVCVC